MAISSDADDSLSVSDTGVVPDGVSAAALSKLPSTEPSWCVAAGVTVTGGNTGRDISVRLTCSELVHDLYCKVMDGLLSTLVVLSAPDSTPRATESTSHTCCNVPSHTCCKVPSHSCCNVPSHTCCNLSLHTCCSPPYNTCCSLLSQTCCNQFFQTSCSFVPQPCCNLPSHTCYSLPFQNCCDQSFYSCGSLLPQTSYNLPSPSCCSVPSHSYCSLPSHSYCNLHYDTCCNLPWASLTSTRAYIPTPTLGSSVTPGSLSPTDDTSLYMAAGGVMAAVLPFLNCCACLTDYLHPKLSKLPFVHDAFPPNEVSLPGVCGQFSETFSPSRAVMVASTNVSKPVVYDLNNLRNFTSSSWCLEASTSADTDSYSLLISATESEASEVAEGALLIEIPLLRTLSAATDYFPQTREDFLLCLWRSLSEGVPTSGKRRGTANSIIRGLPQNMEQLQACVRLIKLRETTYIPIECQPFLLIENPTQNESLLLQKQSECLLNFYQHSSRRCSCDNGGLQRSQRTASLVSQDGGVRHIAYTIVGIPETKTELEECFMTLGKPNTRVTISQKKQPFRIAKRSWTCVTLRPEMSASSQMITGKGDMDHGTLLLRGEQSRNLLQNTQKADFPTKSQCFPKAATGLLCENSEKENQRHPNLAHASCSSESKPSCSARIKVRTGPNFTCTIRRQGDTEFWVLHRRQSHKETLPKPAHPEHLQETSSPSVASPLSPEGKSSKFNFKIVKINPAEQQYIYPFACKSKTGFLANQTAFPEESPSKTIPPPECTHKNDLMDWAGFKGELQRASTSPALQPLMQPMPTAQPLLDISAGFRKPVCSQSSQAIPDLACSDSLAKEACRILPGKTGNDVLKIRPAFLKLSGGAKSRASATSWSQHLDHDSLDDVLQHPSPARLKRSKKLCPNPPRKGLDFQALEEALRRLHDF